MGNGNGSERDNDLRSPPPPAQIGCPRRERLPVKSKQYANNALLSALTYTPDSSCLVPQLGFLQCQSILQFDDDVYLNFLLSRLQKPPGSASFECALLWFPGYERELDPTVSARIDELRATKELPFYETVEELSYSQFAARLIYNIDGSAVSLQTEMAPLAQPTSNFAPAVRPLPRHAMGTPHCGNGLNSEAYCRFISFLSSGIDTLSSAPGTVGKGVDLLPVL
ncbi:hypothetical protein B0H19DRAFT_1316452 [Mycena capillaripes]|nr:hypothetical protein B0H19DRAFT_1316452 [Mycena capillaripes]